jgi:O-antigen biosynthesis protein WbqV
MVMNKSIIAFIIDATAAMLSFYLGLWIRLGEIDLSIYSTQGVFFAVLVIIVNYCFKIHRGIWRYFNFFYLLDIVKAASLAILLFLLISFFYANLSNIPRSVLIINWLLLIALLALPRMFYRLYFDRKLSGMLRIDNLIKSPIIIVGLGASTELFIAELNRIKNGQYKAVGIIDSNLNRGRRVYDVPVLGALENLEIIIQNLDRKGQKPTRIIVSSEFYLAGKLKKLLKIADKLSIPVSRIPKVTELQHNPSGNLPMLSLPLEDLLRRPQRALDRESIKKLIHNRRILITGAGGSIGSEIARQICESSPAEVCLLDNSEFLLYEIEQEYSHKFPQVKKQARLCDIRNGLAIAKLFREFKPDVVFHAAALKHVPLMERHKLDAVETNILGSKNILDNTLANKVKHFVMISTDKAVDPSSFMGASKRFAELYCQAQDAKDTVISIVRFGNVLGSNGSVVPLFEKQIAAGGPITVTDKQVTRFFMTIREAVGLVLQAATLPNNHKQARIYVLDMGEPVKIIDLAEHMIMLAGLKPNIDIKIEVIGLRPGEKLHEILVTEHEHLEKTARSDIYLANPKAIALSKLKASITKLQAACLELDDKKCHAIVYKVVKG